MLLKRFFWFIPYCLTNSAIIFFFTTWCFLVGDAYSDPILRPTLYNFSILFALLLLLSVPRYLIKGKIPDSFDKGIKQGLLFIAKNVLGWSVCFLILKLNKSSGRLLSIYQVSMMFLFLMSLYAHYRWGKWTKKAEL